MVCVFVRREDGRTLALDGADGELPVEHLLGLIEKRTQEASRVRRLVYQGVELAPHLALSHYGVKAGSTLYELQRLRGGMPASAPRIKMPANNRMHSSAALRTTDMWSNVIGDSSAKANDSGAVSGAGGNANSYEMSQNLLALARLSGASKGNATRGACKKCGEIGHLAFQCFNAIAGKKEQVGDISSTSSDFDENERANSVSTVSSTTSEDEMEAKEKERGEKRAREESKAPAIYVDKEKDDAKRHKPEKRDKKNKKDKKSKKKKEKKSKKSKKEKKGKRSKRDSD